MTSTTTMTTTTKVESKSALKTLPLMTENIQEKKKKKRGDDDDDMKRVRILDGPDPIVKSEDASTLTSSQETKRLDTDISSYEEERRILLDGVAESLSNVISQMARANERLNIKSTELKSKFMNIDNNKHRNRNQRRNAKNRNVVNDDTRKKKMMMMKQYVTLGNCREMEEVATVWREAFRADNNASEGENSSSSSSSSVGGGGGGLPRERVKNVDQRLSLSRSFRGTLNRSSSSVASMTTSFR